MSIQIVGFSDDVKLPGFFAETVYNAGPITAGSLPLKLLLCGTQLSTGTATPNQDVKQVFSTSDADTCFGAGSDLAIQCYGAIQTPGVTIEAAPVPEAGGSAAAAAIINIDGTWTAGGTLTFRIDGTPVSVTALSTDTPSTFSTSVVNAVLAQPHLPTTASAAAGQGTNYVVTLTRKSKGARGNQGALYIDVTQIPAGMKIGIAGGTTTTIAAGSNTKVLPQATITTASVSGFATSGKFYIASLNTTVTYTGTQTAPATTVAAGSDGVNVNTFAGAGILSVTSNASYPASGSVYLPGLGVTITYTALGVNTLTGCTTLAAGAGVIHTGDAVDGTLFTGCTGGSGTLATAQALYAVTPMTGGGVRFNGGTGVESLTTLLSTVIQATQYDRIAPAQNDATNAAAWHTFVNNQAAPLTGILEHLVFAANDTFSNAVSLAQATLNAERAQLLWQNDGEVYPPFLCATFAAYRCAVEQGDPDAAYDGYILPGVPPQSQTSDWPSTATQIACLDSGVTPVTTDAHGDAYIVRSITTHSQDASGNPQYTTLDTSDAVVPDYVRLTLKLFYLTQFKPAFPRVGPDVGATQRAAPAGLATPALWRQQATPLLTALENAAPPILEPGSTAANPIVAEYNAVARRIMSIVPVTPAPNDHQIGVSVRDITSS